jgi:hypothetical protein
MTGQVESISRGERIICKQAERCPNAAAEMLCIRRRLGSESYVEMACKYSTCTKRERLLYFL